MTEDHKIKDIRIHVIDVPAKAVHSHGSGDVAGIKSVIVEIVTDGGITGWGEAAPWPVLPGLLRPTLRPSMFILGPI